MVDTPTTVRTVTTEEMNGWPVSGDALFMLGRANVRADGPLQLDEQDLGGVRVSVLHGWTFYAVTHLAWLEEYLPIGPYGALVIAPNRSLIVAHPLQISAGHPRPATARPSPRRPSCRRRPTAPTRRARGRSARTCTGGAPGS